MKHQLKFIAYAAALLIASSVNAQSAGTWMVRAGAANITPDGPSSNMTAPAFVLGSNGLSQGGSRTNSGADTQLGGGISYMVTDSVSVDIPLALPFHHKLSGAGAGEGVGQIGEVQALPITVFLQYRFLEANSKFRPYVGLGATYAYFFNEQGSGTLTAMTNPGGTSTKLSVESKFILTPQIGATLAIGDKWFVDVFYSKSNLTTKTTLSTGQTVDAALDPASFGISVGYKF
jgi:outer membrane protein